MNPKWPTCNKIWSEREIVERMVASNAGLAVTANAATISVSSRADALVPRNTDIKLR